MPAFARCPECARRVRLPQSDATAVYCPFCDALVRGDADEEDDDGRPMSRRGRPRQQSNMTTLLIAGLCVCGGLVILCAGGIGIAVWQLASSPSFQEEAWSDVQPRPAAVAVKQLDPVQTENYDQARQKFHTKLLRQGAAPQEWQMERPPAGVRQLPYPSGNLRLHAWVSGPPPDARRRPAVLFLHGGFAFGADDWEQTQPFRDAGFVVMTPMLRGENGLPGFYSMFYHEVEDVLAAAEALAKLNYVDSNRIYISGHSVGGTLTMLAAMTSNRFRAAASFSGSPDQVSWSRLQPQLVPFDPSDQREFQMRSPLAFPHSIKCPLRIYYGSQEFLFAANSHKLAQLAKAAGLDVEAVNVPGNHMTMVEPAMKQAIAFFQQN